MARKCRWCGRYHDESGKAGYCSESCKKKGEASESSKYSNKSQGQAIVIAILVAVFTAVFYLFPKYLKGKNKILFYAYIIFLAILIVSVAVYLFSSSEAV